MTTDRDILLAEGRRALHYLIARNVSHRIETTYPRHWFDWMIKNGHGDYHSDHHYGDGYKRYGHYKFNDKNEVILTQDFWNLEGLAQDAMRTCGNPITWVSQYPDTDTSIEAVARVIVAKAEAAFAELSAQVMMDLDSKLAKQGYLGVMRRRQ